MSDTQLTKIGPIRAVKLCIFAGFFPTKLAEAERADNEARNRLLKTSSQEHNAFKVRRALWASLACVLGSIAVGLLIGTALSVLTGPGPARLVAALQGVGATILLWATLFVRGWEIQSWGGVTLTERVNRWIYRFLYCLGTAAIMASLPLS
jgi:hypothetical protein